MGRPARALLDAQALRHNLEQVRVHAPRSRIMAVVKANGYGHGLVWVASTLSKADAFGVASIEEGVALREAGIAQPICLLEGFFTPDELPLLARYQLAPTFHDESQLATLEAARLSARLEVWLKIDTGMHRIGFAPEQAPALRARLKNCHAVAEVRLMSHFASADDPSDGATQSQMDCFMPLVRSLGGECSLANSAGVVAWPSSHLDWVRPGIMLYGVSPLVGARADKWSLQPVMTLQTSLIAVKHHRKNEAVGYGGEWRCPEDMPVGVAAIGYGDGYPRRAPSGSPVLVNGRRAALIGRVSMDMITLDLRSQPQAQVGDPVVLWGSGLPVEEVAASAGTIGYELLCHVAERIPRVIVTKGQ